MYSLWNSLKSTCRGRVVGAVRVEGAVSVRVGVESRPGHPDFGRAAETRLLHQSGVVELGFIVVNLQVSVVYY